MPVDPVRAIADAVLYEGYVLWPYRRSSLKNQQRWTFGGVFPPAHAASSPDDPCAMQTQCLLEGAGASELDVRVRFLHVVGRQALAQGPGGLEPVEELVVGEERHLSWEEAVEREVAVGPLRLDALGGAVSVAVEVGAGQESEDVLDAQGRRGGVVLRSWRRLQGNVEVVAEVLEPGLYRVTIRIVNSSQWAGGAREDALRQSFCSTHTVLRTQGAGFVSLTDPPPSHEAAAEACVNRGTWPVLVGVSGERGTLLSSPIILSDYPEIAPESPGDLFDGGEIDQMLVLNILSLTDEEKREMRDSDPKTREILERTEALSDEEMLRLNGAIRDFGLARVR